MANEGIKGFAWWGKAVAKGLTIIALLSLSLPYNPEYSAYTLILTAIMTALFGYEVRKEYKEVFKK